jgi:PQQ-like domain
VRAWTRNVSFRSDATLDSTDRIVLASSPSGVVTLDPTGDNIRWRYAPPDGCRLLGSDVGSAGVAVLERCSGSPTIQLLLLDGFEGSVHWTRDVAAPDGADVRLLGADRLLGILVGGEVQALAAGDGAVLRTLPVPDDAGRQVQLRAADDVTMVRVAGTLSALDASSGGLLWEAPAIGLPAEPDAVKDDRSPAALLVPTQDGFVHRDPATGAELGRSDVTELPAGGVASGIGPGIVYRVADRVLGYR